MHGAGVIGASARWSSTPVTSGTTQRRGVETRSRGRGAGLAATDARDAGDDVGRADGPAVALAA